MVSQTQVPAKVSDSPIISGVKNDVSETAFSYLGIYTEFSSADIQNRRSILRRRFILQNTARKLLPNNRRLDMCNRAIAPGFSRVRVSYNHERGNARYGNLCKCESGWICPICAVALSERRRFELLQAVTAANERGMIPIHIIYTMKHSKEQALRDLLNILIEAYNFANSGRASMKLHAKYGFFKPVRALEVTESSKSFGNGWHPHLHVMMFVSRAIVEVTGTDEEYAEEVRAALWTRWQRALEKKGGSALEDYGLKVKTGNTYTAEYIAKHGREPREKKWSIEREIAKASSKVAREDGRTPFALLEDAQKGDLQAALLFQEFAEAIKGRSQLHWSPGLKELLQVEVMNDREAIAWGVGYIDRLLIEPETWRELDKKELRGHVLASLVENGGNPLPAVEMIKELTESGKVEIITGNHESEIIF